MRIHKIFLFILVLYSSFSASLLAKPVYVHHFRNPIHTSGCHGLEANYGWSHKMHGVALSYAVHFTPDWYTKFGASFSNKNVLKFFNTYHINIWNRQESSYFNFLFGGQTSHKFDPISWGNIPKPKRFNFGLQLGLELEKYLTDALLLVFLAEFPISFLDKKDIFHYRLAGGLRIAF